MPRENEVLTMEAKVERLRYERGSATIEYVIVSTFAAILSVAAITFVGRLVTTKVGAIAEKVGIEPTEFEFDLGLSQ